MRFKLSRPFFDVSTFAKANLIHWGASCTSTRPRRSIATAFVTEDVKAFKALASVMRHELPEDLETRLRTGRDARGRRRRSQNVTDPTHSKIQKIESIGPKRVKHHQDHQNNLVTINLSARSGWKMGN